MTCRWPAEAKHSTPPANAERQPAMEQEVHIAGIVVHALPAHLAATKARIASLPAAEVHAASTDGKLIVTLETDSTRRILDYMDAIRALQGVVDVALVYQHAEPLTALDQEIPS